MTQRDLACALCGHLESQHDKAGSKCLAPYSDDGCGCSMFVEPCVTRTMAIDFGDCIGGPLAAYYALPKGLPINRTLARSECPFCDRTGTHRGGPGEPHHVFILEGDSWPR